MSQKLHANQVGSSPIVGVRSPLDMRRIVEEEARRCGETFSAALRRIVSEWSVGRGERIGKDQRIEAEAEAVYEMRRIEVDQVKPRPAKPASPRAAPSERVVLAPKVKIPAAEQRRLIALALRSTNQQAVEKVAADRDLRRRQRAEAISLDEQKAQDAADRQLRKRQRRSEVLANHTQEEEIDGSQDREA